jgi:hypothetical protein
MCHYVLEDNSSPLVLFANIQLKSTDFFVSFPNKFQICMSIEQTDGPTLHMFILCTLYKERTTVTVTTSFHDKETLPINFIICTTWNPLLIIIGHST